jgi:hypothetical protein
MLKITELALRDLIERIERLDNEHLTESMKATRLKYINDLRLAGKWDDRFDNLNIEGKSGDASD